MAFINLLLQYAMKFYRSGMSLPNLRQNFVDFCVDSDKWQILLMDHLVITNDENDRLTKQDLADLFNDLFNTNGNYRVSDLTAFSEGRRIGLTYNRALRANSRATQFRGIGPSERGMFVGVTINRGPRVAIDAVEPTTPNT